MEHHVGPLSPLPLLPRVPSEEQADSETESEQEKEAAKRGEQEGVGSLSQDSMASEESRNREETAKSAVHLSGLEKPVMSTDESLLSDSDNGRERQTFVRRRRRNVIRISSGRNDSDIEVKGKLIDASSGSTPPPHGMMPAVGAAVEPNIERGYGGERKGEETGFSDSHISPPSEPSVRLTEQVKEVEGEGQEELQGEDRPPVGFQKLILQMKKRAHSGLGVTIVHGPGVTKGIFMVRRIMAGGVAARDKRVRPGDRLVAINNKSLRNLSHAEVLQTINEAPKEIQLEIWRDPEFELDATSSIYSIGSRSSILSDDDTEDSLSKRQSLISLERFARDGGRTRSSPNVARYSTSIVEHLRSQGHRASPRTPKRWSAVVLSPNIGPAGEILPSPTPLPTSPTHTFTPPNPLPSPNTLTPSPTPHSLSPTPEPTSPFHQSAQFSQPPPSPPPSPPPPSLPTQTDDHAASQKSESDGSQTPPPPPSPSSHLPVSGEDSLTLTLAQTSATQDSTQEDRDRVRGSERNEVERPKSLGPVPKGARLEHGPFEIEITKGIFGLGLTVGLGDVGMITVRALTTRSPITKDGNIRVGDHLLSINDTSLIGVDIATAESVVKGLTRGVVRFVAMAPPKDVTNINSGVKSGETITHQNSPPTHRPPLPSTPPPPLPSTPPPPPVSPPPELVDEPGIIRAKLQRFGTAPLGLVLEGGSDSPLKYIFVQSIASWSPAFNSGLFTKGDQLVMVGSECLIGMSLLQAKQVLEQAPAVVELVAQRKESVRQSPLLASKTEVGSASGRTRGRRMGREESKVDLVKRNELDTSKEESRERKFTGSLTLPERPREGDQTQFSRSISHTDIQTQAGSSISTSLAYATSNTNLNTSWNVSMSGPLRSRTMSVENLEGSSDSLRDSALYHQPLPNHTEPAEDVFVVKLHREAPQKLGLSIVGGVDNPSLQCAHVKRVLPEGLVAQDGRIKRGDRIISVNGQELACLTNNDALALLKSSGSIVSLEVARRVGRRSSQAPSPLNSQLQSRRSSGENTREPPSPVAGNRKRRDSSGSEGAPPTPPNLPAPRKRRSRQESMSPDDNMPGIVKGKAVTMPRKLKSTEGVKIVELHKGPTGLGMQIRGGSDENLPITVREVFPGGTAHKSGKIHPGDVIIEVNNDSFENLTHKEALSKLKSYPQGIIRLLVRDRTVSLTRQAMHQQ